VRTLGDLIQTLAVAALLALAVAAGWWIAPPHEIPTEAEIAADPRPIVLMSRAPER
jgi:hypothetical protein